jgi:hypothetical protein
MMCDNETIQIIELQDAQNNLSASVRLKDEINVVTGMFAVAYVPVEGATGLDGFKEEGQFRCALLSAQFSHCGTVYCMPVYFQNIQGFIPAEEMNFNFNSQLLLKPMPIYKKVESNTCLKIKYRDSVAAYRYKHHIKLYITYIDKN